jgi:DNA-binding transcriptional regulator YdaS (Cro superfamily)
MKLSDYLAEERLTVLAFARRLGVAHTTVGRWINGREPRGVLAGRILGATGGKVTGADLAPRAAAAFGLSTRKPEAAQSDACKAEAKAGAVPPQSKSTTNHCLVTHILTENKRQGWGLPSTVVDEFLRLGLEK